MRENDDNNQHILIQFSIFLQSFYRSLHTTQRASSVAAAQRRRSRDINGFSTIFKTLSTLHFLNIGYGCLSPLNIIVANGKFSFRPPNLSKYQCSCTPPPLVARKRYRFKTEIERYPHDRNLTNSKKTDCLCFGYLLCDYILYFGYLL